MKISKWRKEELIAKLTKHKNDKLSILYLWTKTGYINKTEFIFLFNYIVVEDGYNEN